MSIPRSIIKAYEQGRPLTAAERNIVLFSDKYFGPLHDEIMRFYQLGPWAKKAEVKKNPPAKKPPIQASFLIPHGISSPTDFEDTQQRLQNVLARAGYGVEVVLTPAQFILLRNIIPPTQFFHLENTIEELLYYQGNQLLAGAPFFEGGVPRVDFFQWGNLMGVVKYEELLGEKGIEGNILIYFEDLQDRTLLHAMHDYLVHHLAIEPAIQPELAEPEAVSYTLSRTDIDPPIEPEPEPEQESNTSPSPHLILQPPGLYPIY